ncbi:TerC family protein [Botrimarina mediterranea]|uniref:Inner membrane protein alx n=1 Tax=Botrimarina mediterranea TaxID=2528022 RepID=A0A518K3M4_9BACT|nr:TerC family protein [Botrimarina mediterranea]QDV72379.1 Inner membrane protein alx [Botrimarina mediterranea]QDV76925.1 Inner membrane protein alx [Planctomycetes bacterium K2D]
MPWFVWLGFLAAIGLMVALDLGVFHRRDETPTFRSAIKWTCVWVAVALAFTGVVYQLYEGRWFAGSGLGKTGMGAEAVAAYLTAYVVEKSLSLDNIFVMAIIFSYFRVPLASQHRVLFWGILGAVVLRGAMIFAGVALLHRFEWITYVFGVLLLISAARLLMSGDDEFEPERNLTLRLIHRWLPISKARDTKHFFVTENGKTAATTLFLALVMVETTDVMFAVDSIPAVFAVTRDPFLVFTSNIFAILGLRSLYFALAGFMDTLKHLKTSLVFVLAYVGVKMLLAHHYPIPNLVSLAVIGGILGVGVVASLVGKRKPAITGDPTADGPDEESVAN